MNAHTPGPWTIPARDSGVTVNAGHGIVAEVYAVDVGTTQIANARLIAAAPDLLEALHDALVQLECSPMVSGYSEVVKRARAALCKAGL
jgi:hypothetical protein